MISPAKTFFYLIEFINCYAAIYYSNFIYFYLRRAFGFGEMENLLTAAAGGFVYIIASWQGGKLSHRYGGVRMLYTGSIGVIVALALGMIFRTPAAQVVVYCLWCAAICMIWPAIETLISERSGASLSKMVGIYNVTWAGGSAIAYFSAGILIEKFGTASMFWLPVMLTALNVLLLPFAAKQLQKEADNPRPVSPVASTVHPADTTRFLKMAWIANPFSYVAINTVIPLIPSIAAKLHLSTAMAGIVCSLWMFSRLAAFALLWHWSGWHYRFRWLVSACILMIICFFALLSTQSLGWLLAAQVGFGLSIGLIYYSSLYYSMNVTENQAANAGLHEAMIGAGLFAGPAVAATTLYLFPQVAGIGAWSVGGLLCLGFSGLLVVRYQRKKT